MSKEMTNDARTINDAMELVKEFCEERDCGINSIIRRILR